MDIRVDLFDARDYFNARKIEYITEGKDVTSGWLGIRCPFCDDTGHHLGINLSSNLISCWRCGVKGPVTKIVQEIERISFQEALEVLEKFPRPFYQQTIESPKYIPKKGFKLPEKFSRVFPNNVPSHVKRFLRSRGFDPQTIVSQKELYFANYNSHKYCLRLIVPIFMNRKMVSFVARDTTGKAIQKYLNCPNDQSLIPIKETLYGYDDVPPGSNIIIVEGVFDQWKLGCGALATYGTQWTFEQIQLIKSLRPSKVFILFDNEPDAQKSAYKLAKNIWFADTENLTLKELKDPGELDYNGAKEVRRWAEL